MWRIIIAAIVLVTSAQAIREIKINCDVIEYSQGYGINCSLPLDIKDEKSVINSKIFKINRDVEEKGISVYFKGNSDYPEYMPIGIGRHFPMMNTLLYRKSPLKFITRENFADMMDVNVLFMEDNQIESIPSDSFNDLPKLVAVVLKRNKIRELHPELFANNPMVENLEFEANEISEIKPELIENLHELQVVTFEKNKIKRIEDGTFRNNPKMTRFYLDKNRIKYFKINFLEYKDLTGIYLLGNDGECDFIYDHHKPPFELYTPEDWKKWTTNITEFQFLAKRYCQNYD